MVRKGIPSQSLLYKMYFLRFYSSEEKVFGYDNKACENPTSMENFTHEERCLLDEENLIFHAPLRSQFSTELEKGGGDVWRRGKMAQKLIIQSLSSESMTHLRHVLLVKGECDVGTAVVLVREAGVAFGGWRGCRGPTLSETGTGFDKAVLFFDGNTGLACRTPISGLSCLT